MTKYSRHLLVVTLVVTSISLALCIASLAASSWLNSQAVLTTRLKSQIQYGLFTGSMDRAQLASTLHFELAVVCDFGQDACMFSCQRHAEARKDELRRILIGANLEPCDQARARLRRRTENHSLPRQRDNYVHAYFPASLWVSTCGFLALSCLLSATALGFTLLNLYTHPVERIFNIFGLYIWHGGAVLSALLALTMWLALFAAYLQHNVAVTDTLRQELTFSSEGLAELGFSFYAALVGCLLDIVCIGVLFVRRHLESASRVSAASANKIDVPLEFY